MQIKKVEIWLSRLGEISCCLGVFKENNAVSKELACRTRRHRSMHFSSCGKMHGCN